VARVEHEPARLEGRDADARAPAAAERRGALADAGVLPWAAATAASVAAASWVPLPSPAWRGSVSWTVIWAPSTPSRSVAVVAYSRMSLRVAESVVGVSTATVISESGSASTTTRGSASPSPRAPYSRSCERLRLQKPKWSRAPALTRAMVASWFGTD